MAFKDIKAGKYLAKPVQGAFGKSKEKGTPQVGIEFEFQTQDGGTERMWWIGYLTEKAKDRALETLAMIGFNGDENFGEGSFDPESQVELDISLEEYEGKMRPRINWVNEPGGKKFSDLPVTEVKSMLIEAGIDIKKEMAALRAKKGGAATSPKPSGKAPF